jgi:hypothetical protein
MVRGNDSTVNTEMGVVAVYSTTLWQFWILYAILSLFKIQCFRDWILSLSSGVDCSVGANR